MFTKEIIQGVFVRFPNLGIQLTEVHSSIAANETLKILQSRRQKRREEALVIIKSTWLFQPLRTTVVDWDLRIDISHEIEAEHFHMCKISIMNGATEISCITLDGWSGFLRHRDDTWIRNRQATPEWMNEILLKDIEHYFEVATTT